MKTHIATALLTSILLAAPTGVTRGAAIGWSSTTRGDEVMRLKRAESEMRIGFSNPADWRCVDEDDCTRCRNVSAHDSDVVIDQGEGSTAETFAIPAGYSLETCHGPDPAI